MLLFPQNASHFWGTLYRWDASSDWLRRVPPGDFDSQIISTVLLSWRSIAFPGSSLVQRHLKKTLEWLTCSCTPLFLSVCLSFYLSISLSFCLSFSFFFSLFHRNLSSWPIIEAHAIYSAEWSCSTPLTYIIVQLWLRPQLSRSSNCRGHKPSSAICPLHLRWEGWSSSFPHGRRVREMPG